MWHTILSFSTRGISTCRTPRNQVSLSAKAEVHEVGLCALHFLVSDKVVYQSYGSPRLSLISTCKNNRTRKTIYAFSLVNFLSSLLVQVELKLSGCGYTVLSMQYFHNRSEFS